MPAAASTTVQNRGSPHAWSLLSNAAHIPRLSLIAEMVNRRSELHNRVTSRITDLSGRDFEAETVE
eukprot:6962-Eustigmatos_ZCMA.PRE.1